MDNSGTSGRGFWGSRIGFIFAAAGSAVGLGNIWRFSYVAGENGGGLFIVIYLALVLLFGLPIMISEFMLGRRTQRDPITAFRVLRGNKSPWQGIGVLGVATAFIILSYYSVLSGWAGFYFVESLQFGFSKSNLNGSLAERVVEVDESSRDAMSIRVLYGISLNDSAVTVGNGIAELMETEEKQLQQEDPSTYAILTTLGNKPLLELSKTAIIGISKYLNVAPESDPTLRPLQLDAYRSWLKDQITEQHVMENSSSNTSQDSLRVVNFLLGILVQEELLLKNKHQYHAGPYFLLYEAIQRIMTQLGEQDTIAYDVETYDRLVHSELSQLEGNSLLTDALAVTPEKIDGLTDEILKKFNQLELALKNQTLLSNRVLQIILHFIFMLLVIGVIIMGVKKGIERISKIMMPLLFGILILLTGYTIERNLAEGGWIAHSLSFMWSFDASKFKLSSLLEAFGQAFFSLSLGMGAMITYGSYLRRESRLVSSGVTIVFLDTLVAILAGTVIFAIVLEFGGQAAAGPTLMFESLPLIFAQIPMGEALAILFFALLIFAAFTSAISLLEVPVAFMIQQFKLSRAQATLLIGSVIFLLGVPSALSLDFFNLFDSLASKIMLPLGGVFICLFVGWVMKNNETREEFRYKVEILSYPIWRFVIKYIAPIVTLFILLYQTGLLPL